MSQITTKFIANGAITTAKLASVTGTGTTVVLSASPTITGTLNAAAVSLTGALNMNNHLINNVTDPVSSQDAATKNYVDSLVNGLTWKGPVQAFANSNVPLTGGATLTIDGYSVQNGNLVILGNQTTASQNGEYTASGIGAAYTLTPNGQPTAAGDAWLVLNGTLYANSAFVATSAVPTAAFVEFAGPQALSYTAPLSITGNTVSISQATTSTNGFLTSTDWNTFNNKQPAGSYITALTGDVTASGPGSAAATLATVNGNVGTFGSSTSIPTFTVNAKGLITAASGNAVIAPAGTLSGTTLNATVVSSSLTSVGTITTGVWNGTAIGPTFGGTGQTSYTTGDTLYASATNTLSKLPIGTSGQVLTVAGGVPTWATATTGANTSLSNLTATAINQSLIPNAGGTFNLGSTADYWTSLFVGTLRDASGVVSINNQARLLVDSSAVQQMSWDTSGVEISNELFLEGSTSGAIGMKAAATTTSYAVTYPAAQGTGALTNNGSGVLSWTPSSGGTVTSVSVATANGFAGTVATATTTPAITISTTVTGILAGNGTSVSAATAANFPTITDGITTNQSGASSTIQSLRPVSFAYTLTSTDITNQFVDLKSGNGFPSSDAAYGTTALSNSVTVNPNGGPLQTKGVDFTISLTGGAGGSTRVTFAGDLATGGNAALVAGDVVTFSYSYL